jgi:hypothetical protein
MAMQKNLQFYWVKAPATRAWSYVRAVFSTQRSIQRSSTILIVDTPDNDTDRVDMAAETHGMSLDAAAK